MLTKIILSLFLISLIIFTIIFARDYWQAHQKNLLEKESKFLTLSIVGFVALFLDTLGIGSFSIITASSKNFQLIKDKVLPGTLMVSTTIPGIVMAFMFITTFEVDPLTLIVMTTTATTGAYFGASVISKLSEKAIQLVMGFALAIVAILVLIGQLGLMPIGGDAIGLEGIQLVIVAVTMFCLGGLMNLGVGLFAPCLAVVFAMGMSLEAAFPIMTTACAILQPAASYKFIKEESYDRKAALAITIFGVLATIIAVYFVKSISIVLLKWLVFIIVLYTSFKMFKSYLATTAK